MEGKSSQEVITITHTHRPEGSEAERQEYTVARPMFKNGKEYQPGEKIMLDEMTAANFRREGDIE